MVESGEFSHDDPDLDYKLDHDDDDKQEVERTQTFQPGAASTPYHVCETIEIQMRQHEKSGLPDTSYQEETPFLSSFIHLSRWKPAKGDGSGLKKFHRRIFRSSGAWG